MSNFCSNTYNSNNIQTTYGCISLVLDKTLRIRIILPYRRTYHTFSSYYSSIDHTLFYIFPLGDDNAIDAAHLSSHGLYTYIHIVLTANLNM